MPSCTFPQSRHQNWNHFELTLCHLSTNVTLWYSVSGYIRAEVVGTWMALETD